jgi:SAM-dependent methyltransferase
VETGTTAGEIVGAGPEHFDSDEAARLVEFSIRKYRRAHKRYERNHPEIFNPVEQGRLREELERAVGQVRAQSPRRLQALDLGSGSGNVTRHLLDLDLEVIAADVSPDFLREIEMRFGASGRVSALCINGQDLREVPSASLDMVCAYSVLHHVPNYLAMVEEACRTLRPGGVLYIDHEANDNFYDKTSCFWDLMREGEKRRIEGRGWWNPDLRRWQRYLMPSKYVKRVRRIFDPAYPWNVEGDIHTWKLKRIEWDRIEARLARQGLEVVRRSDYLAYSSEYPDDIWSRYEGRCSNMRLLTARKVA